MDNVVCKECVDTVSRLQDAADGISGTALDGIYYWPTIFGVYLCVVFLVFAVAAAVVIYGRVAYRAYVWWGLYAQSWGNRMVILVMVSNLLLKEVEQPDSAPAIANKMQRRRALAPMIFLLLSRLIVAGRVLCAVDSTVGFRLQSLGQSRPLVAAKSQMQPTIVPAPSSTPTQRGRAWILFHRSFPPRLTASAVPSLRVPPSPHLRFFLSLPLARSPFSLHVLPIPRPFFHLSCLAIRASVLPRFALTLPPIPPTTSLVAYPPSHSPHPQSQNALHPHRLSDSVIL